MVTGASRGIGRAIAERFAAEGAAVVVNYAKRAVAAQEVVSRIQAAGGRAIAVQADVSDPVQVDGMVDRAAREWGGLDILINNAGIYIPGQLTDVAPRDFDRLISVNVNGVLIVTRAAVPHLCQHGNGSIVNLSSLAGIGTASTSTNAYAVTKASVISMTQSLALELGPRGVRVNAISPGFVETEMSMSIPNANDDGPSHTETMVAKSVLGRIGQPEDIAHAALFLASDEASFITGQSLTVDGGRFDLLTRSA